MRMRERYGRVRMRQNRNGSVSGFHRLPAAEVHVDAAGHEFAAYDEVSCGCSSGSAICKSGSGLLGL